MTNGRNKNLGLSKGAIWCAIILMPAYVFSALLILLLPLQGNALSWLNEYTISAPLLVFVSMIVLAGLNQRKAMLALGILSMIIGVYLTVQGFVVINHLDNAAIQSSTAFWAIIQSESNYQLYALPIFACSTLIMILSAIYTYKGGTLLARKIRPVDTSTQEWPIAERRRHLKSPWQ
jgi:hypothetical protein